jgi:MoxR-like ATPase
MAELQVSADGESRPLPKPFVVLATDNPIEYEGTYPLPEAELDRFTVRVRLGYLARSGEIEMLRRRLERGSEQPMLRRIADPEQVMALRESLESVEVDDDLLDYVVRLLAATRTHSQVAVGASPRGGLALVQCARARAVLRGRDFVTPQDVKDVAIPVLAHRITVRPELWLREVAADEVVTEVLAQTSVPSTHPVRGTVR